MLDENSRMLKKQLFQHQKEKKYWMNEDKYYKMEHDKISKWLNDFNCFEVCGKKWIEVNDLSGGQYFVNKNIRFKTSMLRSSLCNYDDTCIVLKGRICVTETNNANRRNKKLPLVILHLNHVHQKSITHL